MKIGIIGAGEVGSTLGRARTTTGHAVVYGVRQPTEAKHGDLVQANAEMRSVRQAVTTTEAVILATPWNATEAALAAAGGGAPRSVLPVPVLQARDALVRRRRPHLRSAAVVPRPLIV